MKVEECQKCNYYQRRTWTSSYKPQGYHKIGVTHAYGFCLLNKCRCLDVKKCEMKGENHV